MKRIITLILIIMLTGVIPSFAETLEFTSNETISVDLPSGWYMDETKKLYDSNGIVGYVDGKSYDEALSNISTSSLDFLKTKILNNIMYVESIGSGIHFYEAETTSGIQSYVVTVLNSSYDYMFIMCVYQSKISYTTFKNLAQTVAIDFIPGEIIVDEEVGEEIIEIVEEDIEIIEIEEEIVPEDPKPGQAIGYVLSTDIVAYIDDMPITSYNVDGKTVVIVEELVNYGFKVTWDADARKLIVTTSKLPIVAPEYVDTYSDLPIGTPVGEIYVTDIVTEINGREYESYNINGQTVVVLESLGDRMIDTEINIYNPYKYSSGGFKTLWDADTRTINLYCIRPGDMIDTFIGSVQIKAKTYVMTPVEYSLNQYSIGNEIISALEIDGQIYVDLQKYCELLNVTCELSKNNTVSINTNEAIDIDFNLSTIISSSTKEDMILPLDLLITNGKSTTRSNNSDIAYYYKDGTIMVDINVVKDIIR